MTTRHIQISGLVQGVGFRPYVYHLASENCLKGWVRNSTAGLEVLIQGDNEDCENFLGSLPKQVPVGTDIQKIQIKDLDHTKLDGFSIISSKNGFDVNTDIAPDLATCELCLEDIYKQPRRYHHLFTSCIHCGPRFSIIKKVPYDRDNTTMNDFAMCSGCKEEYEDIHNRRFHAQPIACLSCGPHYILNAEKKIISDQQEIVSLLVNMLGKGKIIAIKGIGGYHLLCDPFNDDVVKRVRRIKKRDNKPLALLFKDLSTLREYICIHPVEESLVFSSRRPIVIAEGKKSFSWYINQGLKSVGVMLPYMPLHFILMDKLSLPALVCTSANYSGEPLISDNEKALKQLMPVCDAVLVHDRNIENSQDDSVVKIIGNQPVLIRRSRGYAPQPVS
ncbi:MAG: carbamoyltransferase HypF, partial [Bacteroidales bacterium]|nr:carbamoyltransferase HypF [Bacteroidales bacterium]